MTSVENEHGCKNMGCLRNHNAVEVKIYASNEEGSLRATTPSCRHCEPFLPSLLSYLSSIPFSLRATS